MYASCRQAGRQGRAGQGRAGQGRAGPGRAGAGRAGRAGQGGRQAGRHVLIIFISFQNVEQNVRSTKTKWITDFVIMPQYNKFIVGTG